MSVQRFTFGPFELDAMRLELRRDGVRLNVGARACRLLVALVQRPGEIVTQRELMSAGWSGLQVADVNLRVHIVALRKALSGGPDGSFEITTVPREGYVFAGIVSPSNRGTPTEEPLPSTRMVPRQLTTLFGREEALASLSDAIAAHRIVTLVGPGGVGKTALALTAIAEYAGHIDECVFVDFSTSVSSPHVEARLFEALELGAVPNDIPAHIERALRGRTILLVLDNCEQVVGHVAAIVAALTSRTEGVSILATSREPLRVPGERVFPLGSLSCPSEGAMLTAQGAMAFGAIQMFAEAAGRRSLAFAVDDANASFIGEVCRRLDGNPLAIELAAATSDMMSIAELANRLDDRFTVLTRGARTALPRHRTLQAALDWSYDALGEEEARLMRRLGVFPGRFTPENASTVVGDDLVPRASIHQSLADLTAKSLLTVDFSGETTSFRFLETMRVYAKLKLLESDEAEVIHARFADHTLRRIETINQLDGPDIGRSHSSVVDDWRSAHDWSVRRRDWLLALTLMAAGIGFCNSLNIRKEYVHRAIETLRMRPAAPQNDDARWLEMRVCGHAALMLIDTQPPDPPNFLDLVEAMASRSLELSKQVDAAEHQMSALVTLTIGAITAARVEDVEEYGARVFELAQRLNDQEAMRTAYYLNAYASYYRSDFDAAVSECDRSMEGAAGPAAQVAFDHVPSVRVLRARALWIRGEFSAGLAEMDEAHRDALAGGHVPTMAWVAWCGMCIHLWAGRTDKAADSANLHEQLASEYRYPGWSRYIQSVRLAFQRLRDGGRSFGSPAIDWTPQVPSHADMMTSIHCGFHRPSDLQRIDAAPRHWCASEHMRAAGEHHLAAGRTADAEKFFRRALSTSKSHAAVAWQIRSSISLARLLLQQQRNEAARAVLEPLVERFSQATDNADLGLAAGLLSTC